jgi:hypothetical protein
LALINGVVYVTNDGTANGATADSLVLLDTSGNHLSTVALTNTVSPFGVMAFQGDILVSGSSNSQDVFRYTLAGAPVGTFHDSATLNFVNQISLASDGNVWVNCLTSTNVVKLDATTGAPLMSFPAAAGAASTSCRTATCCGPAAAARRSTTCRRRLRRRCWPAACTS